MGPRRLFLPFVTNKQYFYGHIIIGDLTGSSSHVLENIQYFYCHIIMGDLAGSSFHVLENILHFYCHIIIGDLAGSSCHELENIKYSYSSHIIIGDLASKAFLPCVRNIRIVLLLLAYNNRGPRRLFLL